MVARISGMTSMMLLITLFGVSAALAQDNHYWKMSYGTEATLLNGAVIGRTMDMSAAFYNPAGIATLNEASVLLGAHTYEYGGVTVEGTDQITNKPIDVGNVSLRPAPSFIGGTIPFPSLGRHRIAYSVLTRQTAETRIAYRRGTEQGGEDLQLEYLNENDMSENWVGLSWAYGFSDRAAVGATLFTAVRSQTFRRQFTGQVLHEDNEVGLASGINEFSYDSWRIVPKLGTMFDLSPVTLGVTVTAPSLGLFGSGSSFYNATSTGIDLNGDGEPDSELTSNYQEDLSSDFSSGLSVGFGAAMDVGPTTLFGSAEWFASRGPTRVIDSAPFTSQSNGGTYTNELILKNKAVLNGALGVRHKFSDTLAGYLSVATDFTPIDTTLAVSLGRTPWDLYHFGGGAQITINKLKLVLGGVYSAGSAPLEADNAAGIPLPEESNITLSERSFRFLFGFELGFGNGTGTSKGSQSAS